MWRFGIPRQRTDMVVNLKSSQTYHFVTCFMFWALLVSSVIILRLFNTSETSCKVPVLPDNWFQFTAYNVTTLIIFLVICTVILRAEISLYVLILFLLVTVGTICLAVQSLRRINMIKMMMMMMIVVSALNTGLPLVIDKQPNNNTQ